MKIYWCQTTPANVGDALNKWLWPQVLPRLANSPAEGTFFGIGSVLDSRVNILGTRYVLGSGARAAEHGVDHGETLHILAVRGPLTASALGLNPAFAATDPALMLNRLYERKNRIGGGVGLVPYFASPHDIWQEMAGRLGFRLISPRLDVLPFLDALAECEFVVTEAMHGAIIADALRIPWYPIRANSLAREGATSSFKWSDWCGSVGLEFSPLDLPPFWPRQKGYLNRVRATVKMAGVERSLKKLARGRVRYLSSDRVLESRLAQLNDIILGFDESVLGGMDSLGGRRGDTG